MVKATTSTETAAAFILRLYGIGCLALGLIALWFALTIKAGTQGVVDWTRLWPELTLIVMLGFSVFLLLRWLVVAFSILSASCGIFYIGWTMVVVPFPSGLFNLLFAILLIIPAFLTHCAWHSLR